MTEVKSPKTKKTPPTYVYLVVEEIRYEGACVLGIAATSATAKKIAQNHYGSRKRGAQLGWVYDAGYRTWTAAAANEVEYVVRRELVNTQETLKTVG